MEEKNIKIIGIFLGILATIVVSELLFSFFTLPLLTEYIVIITLTCILCSFGIGVAKMVLKGRKR
jgi:hypothetical protein